MESTRSLTKKDVLELWSGSGYVHFNGFLARDKYPFFSLITNTIKHNGKKYYIGSLVSKLQSFMTSYSEYRMINITRFGRGKIFYYRGEELSLLSTQSYIRETFISVTRDYEQAVSFNGDSKCGCMFQISINDDVNCIETGIEKELLLEPGCYWKFKGIKDGLHIVEICTHEEGIFSLGEMLSEMKIENHQILHNNEIISKKEEQSINVYEQIDFNIDLFNIADLDEYSMEDFISDLKAFEMKFIEGNVESLFLYYKSLVKKDS